MLIYTKDGQKVRVDKIGERPRFKSGAFGRTWQWGTCWIDEKDYRYTYDNTWGTHWYFELNGKWYKVSIFNQYEPHYNMRFFSKKLGD